MYHVNFTWNSQIYDGSDTSYNRLAYLTGIKDGGFSYTTTGNHMLIHMITGDMYGFEGFYAEYNTGKNICKNQAFENIQYEQVQVIILQLPRYEVPEICWKSLFYRLEMTL